MFGKLTKAVIILAIIILGIAGYFLFLGNEITEQRGEVQEFQEKELLRYKMINFSQFNSSFRFAGKIPTKFEVKYIPQLEAVSIYNLELAGNNTREKSQIYITYFEADRFLILNTVDIINREELLIEERDAVFYEIEKKQGVADFYQQPNWRNKKHKAIDIRSVKNTPSLFYSFAYNPDLSEELFNDFINSLEFHE